MNKHIYKNLPVYGFMGAILLILGSVLIFNNYWSALGENPKTALMLEITKDYEEFKDYTALIIALIAAVGSLLSSLLIMLFYGAWKDQHNKTEDAKLAKDTYLILQEEKETLIKFKTLVKRVENSNTPIFTTVNANEIETLLKNEIIFKIFFVKSNLVIFEDLTGDAEFVNKIKEHSKSIDEISDFWLPFCSTPTNIKLHVTKTIELVEHHEKCILNLQKILKEYIRVK